MYASERLPFFFHHASPHAFDPWNSPSAFDYSQEDQVDDKWFPNDTPFRGLALFDDDAQMGRMNGSMSNQQSEEEKVQGGISESRQIPIERHSAEEKEDQEGDLVGCRQCTFDNKAWDETCKLCGSRLDTMDHPTMGVNAEEPTQGSVEKVEQSHREKETDETTVEVKVGRTEKLARVWNDDWSRLSDSEADQSDADHDGFSESWSSMTNGHSQTDLELANREEKSIARDGNCLFESFAHSVNNLPGRRGHVDAPSIRAVFCAALEEWKAHPEQQNLLSPEVLKELSWDQIDYMKASGVYASNVGDLALYFLSRSYHVNIKIYDGDNGNKLMKGATALTASGAAEWPIIHLVKRANHYNSSLPLESNS
mmetsp:Transcript_1369/g.2593  ORF Transcript_1369/g.2593 Transcript_1369/m.2593 type:complete len:368 (+) Transcript_1369:86-1189(+)